MKPYKLSERFYGRANVVDVAKDLIGKVLVTTQNEGTTSGIIVETEAYSQSEKGCHAHKGKTARNAVMFENGGISYVYLCYGLHHMFNVVTNRKGVADAVLIRALEPMKGGHLMRQRSKAVSLSRITSGPGKLCKAMGIDKQLNTSSLMGDQVWIEDQGIHIPKGNIIASPRIGIDYAGQDALLPWRFYLKENGWVSRS
jgi:DNA-3-methyladenine glycosylase